MRRFPFALLALVAMLTACESEPTEQSSPPEAVEAEPEAKPALTEGPDAFEGAEALKFVPSAGLDLVVATSNARELATALGVEPVADTGLRSGAPVLADLHPDTLEDIGLDPNGPVGFGRYRPYKGLETDGPTETARWFVYGKVADRERLEAHFVADGEEDFIVLDAPEESEDAGAKQPKTARLRNPLELTDSARTDVFVPADGDWVLLASAGLSPITDASKSIAEDSSFVARRGDMKYGRLFAAFVGGENPFTIGAANEADGLGVRTVASDAESSKAAVGEFITHLPKLKTIPGGNYGILGLLGAGSVEEFEELEAKIDAAKKAPVDRQHEALAAAVTELKFEDKPSEGGIVNRVYAGTDSFAAVLSDWKDAGITDEEAAAIDKLEVELAAKRQKAESKRLSNLFGSADLKGFEGLGGFEAKGVSLGSGGLGEVGKGGGGFGGGGLGGLGTGVGKGGGGTGYGSIGGLGSVDRGPRRTVVVGGSGAAYEYAKLKQPRLKRCFTSKSPKAPFSVTASVSSNDNGSVSIGSVSGGDSTVQSCVKRALGGVGAPDMNGNVTLRFIEK